MQEHWCSLYILAIFMIGLESKLVGQAFQPEFAEPITNLTVPVGRDATFRCLVHNLGGYRVGWVKADTKAIQAIHDHVITNNPRVGVSHNGQTVWNLHIRNVQEYDRGHYMCQINTDPMQSQMGYLEVVIPPDFVAEETSGDIMVPEGGTARVACRARGQPMPRIMWRREDGSDIVIRDANGAKKKASIHEDEVLTLTKISRSDMGAYLCIASNGVPPSVSKRIVIKVHFHPVIQVPNQLVGAPLGTDVTLECYVESSPKSINYWVRDSTVGGFGKFPTQQLSLEIYGFIFNVEQYDGFKKATHFITSGQQTRAYRSLTVKCALVNGSNLGFMKDSSAQIDEMVISSNKYEVVNTLVSSFESRMTLTVRKLSPADVGGYRCVAKNSLGEVDSTIRLYEIPGPIIASTSPSAINDDYKYSSPIEGPDNQFGSAERSDDEDERESINETIIRNQKYPLYNVNSTNNKTYVYNATNLNSRRNLSNKVRKIFDKLEIESRDVMNGSYYLNFDLRIITMIIIIQYFT